MTLQEERDFLMHCRLGKLAECRSYLESGGDPNVKDAAGRGALAKAALVAQNLELVRLLIKYGADIRSLENHLLVLKVTGGPELSPKLKALKERYAEDLAALESDVLVSSAMGKIEASALQTQKTPRGLISFLCFAWPAKNRSDNCFNDVATSEKETLSTSGEYLYRLGLVPIAANAGGDDFCIDLHHTKSLEEMPVYWLEKASCNQDSAYPAVLDDGEKVASSWRDFVRYVAFNAMEEW